jgi:hypothetical protein
LVAAYIGKWMTVTGTVRDIFGEPNALVAQIFDKDGKLVSASFSAEESQKISHFVFGATIAVRGEIDSVDTIRVRLLKCELDRTGPS